MDDTSNWEFAAAVAAISIGLGGLLIFTVVATLGSWRIAERVNRVAEEASQASLAVQDLARRVSDRDAMFSVAPAPLPDLAARPSASVPAPAPVGASAGRAGPPDFMRAPEPEPVLAGRMAGVAAEAASESPFREGPEPADVPEVARLRRDTEMLLEQQGILQDAVRQLIDTGVLRSQGANTEEIRGLQVAVRRIDEQLSRIAQAVSQLEQT